MLKVIGGKYKNTFLEQPKTKNVRPTTAKIREAIFNILQFKIENTIFLDLFAGSGAIGIEAISRGAKKVFLVEKNRQTFQVLKKNCTKIITNNLFFFNLDFMLFLRQNKGKKFDIVYLDPPYKLFNFINSAINFLALNKMISNTSLLILETQTTSNFVVDKNYFLIYDQKKYSDKIVYFLKLNEGKN